jgi:uncharacterized protein
MPAFLLALAFALLACVAPAVAPGAGAQPLTIPSPAGQVNDFAGVMPAEQRARLEAIARQVRDRSGGEIAVVTLTDIGPREAGDVALQIGREWKVGAATAVGDRTRNTGVVVLLVPKETSTDGRGKFAISTGQGTEGFLTDAETGAIRRETLGARQARAYGDALELTTVRLAQAYAKEFGFALDSAGAFAQVPPPDPYARRRRPAPRGGISPLVLLIGFFVVFSVLSSMAGRGRRRGCGGCVPLIIPFPGGGFGGGGGGWSSGGWGSGGGWGGGGGGGGFGGFGGGGGFSGGGSSDSW